MNDHDQSHDPIPASGSGHEAFSMPDLFFMTHRRQIDQWASLRSSAAAAYQSWMRETVHPALSEMTPDGYEHLLVREGRYESSLWVPPNARLIESAPAIGLGLSWSTASSELARPFATIEVASGTEPGKAAREAALVADGRTLRAKHGYSSQSRWPVWRYVELGQEWWAHLDTTVDVLTAEASFLLATFQEAVEAGSAAAARTGS